MSLSADAQLVSQSHRKAPARRSVSLPHFAMTLQRIVAAWIKRQRQAREMQALYRFNDRELWDIGLGRSDLPAIENGTFRRD
jgi:uncharacterized protein YjiS (DUF1127 family)